MGHTAKRIYSEVFETFEGYEYRGQEIRLDRSVPTTYWGRYKIQKRGFTTLAEAKRYVDAKFL